GARLLRRADAARVRHRDRRGPLRVAARRARGPARGARAGRAPPAGAGRGAGGPARPRVKGGWIVGLLGVLALAYITANSLRTEGVGSRGPVAGEPLPQFAAPLASSDLDNDANVQEDACRVHGPEVMNVCDLAAGKPLVLAFVVPGVGECERQVDVLDELAPRFPGVRFAAVAVRGKREAVRDQG